MKIQNVFKVVRLVKGKRLAANRHLPPELQIQYKKGASYLASRA